jgi:lipopolysaccharide/colanic/teichoic acid biosynthesis glycosyltransferase
MLETTGIKEERVAKKVSIRNEHIVLRDYIEGKYRYLSVKRLFDVVISVFLILFVFSWLFPILFILIKIDSGGPVFFVQKRVGFLGRSFSCLKFRTMYRNLEANTKQATDNDPRITKVGRFLRNSNLDELPQFLNVLLGHMSIVGPRRTCITTVRISPI